MGEKSGRRRSIRQNAAKQPAPGVGSCMLSTLRTVTRARAKLMLTIRSPARVKPPSRGAAVLDSRDLGPTSTYLVLFLYLLLRVDSCSWHLLFFTYYIHPTTVLLPSAACLLLHATSRNPRAIYPTQAKQARTTAPSNCLALTCVPGKAPYTAQPFCDTPLPPVSANTSYTPKYQQ